MCILPFSVHGITIEFDGQRDINKQRTFFRNSCCCNLIPKQSDDDHGVQSDTFQDIRDSIRQGKLHPRCAKCTIAEQQTGSSERTLNLSATAWPAIEKFVRDGQVGHFDFRIKFSNLCNLACRSCSPTFSSRYAHVHGTSVPDRLTSDIADDPKIWQDIIDALDRYLDQHEHMTISLFGGESFIQPGAWRLIEYLDQRGLSQRLTLDVTTNFTTLVDRFLDRLPRFRDVSIKASIDSVEENFEYVRWPGKWTDIIQNVENFFSQPHYSRVKFTVQPLINLNNVFYLEQILDFWFNVKQRWPDRIFGMNTVMMYRPFHMTIPNLPLRYRPPLIELLERSISHPFLTSRHAMTFRSFLEDMRHSIMSDQNYLDQFELFLYDAARLDRNYQSNMSSGNQKFYQLFDNQHRDLYQGWREQTNARELPKTQMKIYHQLPL